MSAIDEVIKAARQLLADADREWEVPPQIYESDRADLRHALRRYDAQSSKQEER